MSRRYLFTVVVFVLWILGFQVASSMGGIDLWGMFLRVSPWSVLVGLTFYVISASAGIFILYRALGYAGVKAPFKGVAKGWIFGSFIDNISPTVAPLGQVGITYFMERFYDVAYSKSLAAIGMYVSAWGVGASMFSTVGIILAHLFVGIPQEYLFFALLALAFYFGATIVWLLLLTKKELMRRIVHVLVRPYNKVYNLVRKGDVTFDSHVYDIMFDRSYASLDVVMRNKGHLFTSAALFWILQLGQVTCLYFIIMGFGVSVPFFGILMVHVVSSMISLLSIIPSGLFIYETAIVKLTEAVAPGSGQAILAAVMLHRLIFVWLTNLIGGAIGVIQGIGKLEKRRVLS